MLGDAFYLQFKDDYQLKCTDIDVNEEWLSYCDARDMKEYFSQVRDFNPDYLFHLGALTDLEYCESHHARAIITNPENPHHDPAHVTYLNQVHTQDHY